MLSQEQKEKYQDELDKITYLLDDYNTNHEKWAITTYTNKKGKQKTKFEPVTTSRFIEPLLQNKIVILMSATLPKEGNEAVIECDSPFDKTLQPWSFHPLGKMTKDYRAKTIPKLAVLLSQLQNKTIVHCHSYDVAEKIAENLLMLDVHPFLQVNWDEGIGFSDYETVKRDEAVREFKECADNNKILLSVNLERGVDFPELNITNNVIACIPWDNPTAPLVKAKKEILGEEAYQKDENQRIANKIMQIFGRVNRNNDKKTNTIITASDFNSVNMFPSKQMWFDNHNGLFAKWFLEREVPAQKSIS